MIKPGARISIPRANNSEATFTIRTVQQMDKDTFPTRQVRGNTDCPELRLITCGGPVENGHHTVNVITYADLTADG